MERKEIIYNAVINKTTVGGKFGSNIYTVTDLMDLNIETLDAIYVSISNAISKLSSNSLIKRDRSIKSLLDQQQLVDTIFNIKTEQQAELVKTQKEVKNKQDKLNILRAAKQLKVIEDINKLSLDELNSQIEELE
jgi:hypothetical protein